MSTPYFDHTNHKKLWNWLAQNPKKEKYDWPEWKMNNGDVPLANNQCFACEYDGHTQPSKGCSCCPFGDFSNSEDTCLNGLYDYWDDFADGDERVEYALKIAKLNIRADLYVKVK